MDMLEDYSSEIFIMMVERYAIQLLLCGENLEMFQSQEFSRVVLHIMKCVSIKKTDILKKLGYKAHVDVNTEEYRKYVSLI